MKPFNRPYSSFTDPYLKLYFEDERRLKQLQKFGLTNNNNEVYPEVVYQANIAQAERTEIAAVLKFQKEARQELHKQHLRLHKKWNEQENEKKRQRAASAKVISAIL
ncbi:unnamed protein product [Rotaria sp. Silwood2]|nr:unnamed protein product [Rotaria sp. Silwood2]